MPHFMELRFPLKRIIPKSSIAEKFKALGENPEIHRIFGKVSFITSNNAALIPIDAIIDTGAIISLFPGVLLEEFPEIPYEEHTLWGIVNAPECQIKAKIAVVDVILIDKFGIKSNKLTIPVAFVETNDIQSLIGMKGILASYSSRIDVIQDEFILSLP